MTQIPNKEKIQQIIMKPTCITKCKIGQDWFTNNLEITFIPNDCYPDYIEVQYWIMKNIDGQELNIEEVVQIVEDFFRINYNPTSVEVKDHVVGNKVHFDVDVIK